jgi:hypothetical protein
MLLSLTRRNFALLAAGGLLSTVAGWTACSRTHRSAGAVFSGDEQRLLLTLTARLCGGEGLGLAPERLARAHAGAVMWIDRALAGSQPYVPELVDQVRSALSFVEYAPTLLGSWSRFSTLDAEAQRAVLEDWMRSPRSLPRDVFVAFKGFCTLAFYEQPEICEQIGYGSLPAALAPALARP